MMDWIGRLWGHMRRRPFVALSTTAGVLLFLGGQGSGGCLSRADAGSVLRSSCSSAEESLYLGLFLFGVAVATIGLVSAVAVSVSHLRRRRAECLGSRGPEGWFG